jgi:phosphatidylserine decarboxylase
MQLDKFTALFARYFYYPRHQPGWSIRAAAGAAVVVCAVIYLPLGVIALSGFIYLLMILHLRDKSQLIDQPGQLVAPIDGQILAVFQDERTQQVTIRIRADWLQSQIAYAPISGRIEQQIWVDGSFSAFDDNAVPPADNARQEICISTERAVIEMIYHAGPVSRLFQTWLPEGRQVSPKDAVALGLFRCKMDIRCAAPFKPVVLPGQRCLAGETIIAR